MRKGLSTFQVVCIVLLWVAFCVLLFTVPTNASFGENIFVAILSGIIIAVGLGTDQRNRRRRRD